MAFMDFLTGKPEVTKQMQRFTPEQQGSLQQLLQHAMPQLMGNQFDFGPIEEQARAGFEGKTLPSIASRLTSMGEGARYSSGAQDMFGQAGSDLEKSLASMKQQYGMQQQGQLQNLLGMGLAPQFDTYFQPQTSGLLGGMAPGFGAGFGEATGKGMPGMMGNLTSMLGSLFGGWAGGPPGAMAGGAAGGKLNDLISSLMGTMGSSKWQ